MRKMMRHFNIDGISQLFVAKANTNVPMEFKDLVEARYSEFLSLEHLTRHLINLPIYIDLMVHGDFYEHGSKYTGLPG
jgi:hypothetical protein